MFLNNQTVLVISNEPWGDLWFSKQNYAYELSRNNTVYFINPPKKWKPQNLFSFRVKQTTIKPNLTTIDYQNFFPIINSFVNKINNYWVSKNLNKYLKNNNVEDFIFWSFDPSRLFNPKLFDVRLSIFHAVDMYNFEFIGEDILCKNANIIIANSKIFIDSYKARFKTPTLLIPHAISQEEFHISKTEIDSVFVAFKQFGLYIGIIDERINYTLVKQAALQFPEIDFVFIGPLNFKDDQIAKELFSGVFKNVHSLGPKPFKTLKIYVEKSLFCMSFLHGMDVSDTIAHHKTLIYLAQGKPIFGYRFSEYSNLDEIMYMANENQKILDYLAAFLKNGEAKGLQQQRIEHAKQFTFENILTEIGHYITSMN